MVGGQISLSEDSRSTEGGAASWDTDSSSSQGETAQPNTSSGGGVVVKVPVKEADLRSPHKQRVELERLSRREWDSDEPHMLEPRPGTSRHPTAPFSRSEPHVQNKPHITTMVSGTRAEPMSLIHNDWDDDDVDTHAEGQQQPGSAHRMTSSADSSVQCSSQDNTRSPRTI